jgi:hypothetical protein
MKTVQALLEAKTGRPLGKPRKLNGHAPPIANARPYVSHLSDEQILAKAFASENGGRLKKLLDGDTADYSTASEADLACAGDLAFWFQLNAEKIESIMRESKLMREKWDTTRPIKGTHGDRQTYLEQTIRFALKNKTDYFGKDQRPEMHQPEPVVPDAKGRKSENKKPNGATPDHKAFNYKPHMKPAQDLIDHPPPPIPYLVQDLFARGASVLLIGKPKSFKTTLALQIALALCGNKEMLADWAVFGKITKSYRVCIIDYEQSEAIAAQMMARFSAKKAKGLFRIDKFPKLDAAGIGELRKLIHEQKLDMVIIDSWTRMAPTGERNVGVFASEAEIMQRVTDLAHETGCVIVVIAHAGKRDAADDPMQMIAGTNALPASADDIAVLFKDGEDEGQIVRRKLFVSGRNIAKHGTYILEKLDTETRFVLKGSEDVYVRGETRRKILGLLGGGAALTPTDLAKSLGRDRGQVHRALNTLVFENMILAVGEGRYQRRTDAVIELLKTAKRRKNEPR